MSDETFPGGSGLFVLTSIYRPENKPLIVHSWGPYKSRREANNARNRAKTAARRDAKSWYTDDPIASGKLTFHVGEVFGRQEVFAL